MPGPREHQCSRKHNLARRAFLAGTGGVGLSALFSLLRSDRALATTIAPKAKNCIFFFMEGGPSQFDLFSYKPKLNELDGKRPPEELLKDARFAFVRKDSALLMGTRRQFRQYGQSGLWFSDLVPKLAEHADKICMLNAVATNQFNHHPAQLVTQTGHNLNGHPSMGAWLSYGIGSENQNLPAYVVLNSSPFLTAGESLWQSGFLPTVHGGVIFQATGNPVLNLHPSAGVSPAVERRSLDALSRLNGMRKQTTADPEIASRIGAYELAFRMQTEAPQLVDLLGESPATLDRYGLQRADPPADFNPARKPPAGIYGNFARHCLLARRMVEKGVRFVSIFTGSWDMHDNLDAEMPFFAGLVDQPIAALIEDLDQRGLLGETLLIFAGEFGRTPLGENRPGFDRVSGRDHHAGAYNVFMAGGGVKGGLNHGETDDIGWLATKDPVDISDVHATILRLFGIDHLELTFRHAGLDQRLTPVTRRATVIDEVIA